VAKIPVEHLLSVPADFSELRVTSIDWRNSIHAVSALHGTRLHLTSTHSFQATITRDREKIKTVDSRKRAARGRKGGR
jgi:hypothetical protein